MFAKLYRFTLAAVALLAASAGSFAAPASAQRPIELEVGAAWQHPHSGILVPSALGGLPRSTSTEFTADFLNIGFSFRGEGPSEEISLYIYRHTNGDVPIWFEQARIAIETRDIYAGPKLAFGVEQYGWPGAAGLQGQRAIYASPESEYYTSTAVAIFSVDGWLVKMRVSSASRSPKAMREWIDSAFGEITPPDVKAAQSPAILVEDCDEKLIFKKKAKDAKQDGASALVSALLGGAAAGAVEAADEPAEQVTWCRDAALDPMQVVYRANGSTDSYLLAMGDSGIGISVRPDAASLLLADESKKSKPAFSITAITDTQRINFVPQNRLPSPKRVVDIINDNRTIGAVSTWGEDSTITMPGGSL